MAPGTTHLVIGERVFPQLEARFGPLDYGGFLLGCLLVDVHAFRNIDRLTTHFATRLEKDTAYAFDKSCHNFMSRLDRLLIRPWGEMNAAEQAFVLGYLCHLAADEEWKQFDWEMLRHRGIYLWKDLSVPGDVLLTAFDVLSADLYLDYPSVSSALCVVQVPDVFLHISQSTFRSVWEMMGWFKGL